MDNIQRRRAERISELLRRYMWARGRCVGGDAPPYALSDLVSRLQWGPFEFDGVRVELSLEPAIVWDRDQPAFFRAIIERNDSAMPELEDLAAWRNYVHANGPMPKAPGFIQPVAAHAASPRHSERIDVV